MMYEYEYGQAVRLTRNVRNDGTYPGLDIGHLLIRRGAVGYVRDVGLFLQDQIIYSVDFIDEGKMVGCREEELIGADEPWVPSLYEFRDKVLAKVPLAISGEVVVEAGDEGEIQRVERDEETQKVTYHVRFPGQTFLVPESALLPSKVAAEATVVEE